ncbi:MAG: DNA polymerase III subunit gamma/tau [Xanthomonadales bacterium]|nr:DNA polymerase III subunit gamma/tau [Xanthomonadales bacterium]
MTYQVLARKWRPKNFSEMVGQSHVVQALVNGLDQDRLHHAFLLTGTRGVGKTTLARIFAKCLNCEAGVSSTPCGECGACVDIDAGCFVDMLEIDAASRTKVDDTREMLENVQYAPTRGRYKVYIIDEVHMLSTASFNALLKTLEEPPPHVKFILATTDPQKIPVTVLSRCLRFNLTRLSATEIQEYLLKLLQTESIEADEQAVLEIARAADGSMRDGLSLLDQAIGFGGGKLISTDVNDMLGSLAHDTVVNMLALLFAGDAAGLMAALDEQVGYSVDFDRLLQQLSESLHRIALIQQLPDYRDENRPGWDALQQLSGQVEADAVQLYYQIAIHGRRDLSLAPDPQSGAEMTFLRLLAFRPSATDGSVNPATNKPSKSAQREKPLKPAEAKPYKGAEAAVKSAVAETAPMPTQPQVSKPIAESVNAPVLAAVSIAEVFDKPWNELIELLELRGVNLEFARNIQSVSRAEGIWQFMIADELEYITNKQSVDVLAAAISRLLGTKTSVRITLKSETQHDTGAGAQKIEGLQTPAEVIARQATEVLSQAEKAIKDDPTVLSLQADMGASLIEGSIKPLQ